MNYIIHCSTCKSRSEFDTDRNGHLVEYLNHKCECPPLSIEAPGMDGVCIDCGAPCYESALRCVKCGNRAHDTPKLTRKCIDCGTPIAARRKRCVECFKEKNRRRMRQAYHEERAAA